MAMIVDAFAGKLVERLANVAEDSVLKVLGVKDLLQNLRDTMVRIERRLKDAERTRIENETIKGWIAELKDVMYDADDIIDLCQIQGGLLQDGHSPAESSSNSSPVCCNFPLLSCLWSAPFRYEIADRISNLNDRLKNISTDNDMLKLIPTTSNEEHVAGEASYSPSCSLSDSDIVGQDIIEATRSLVELIVAQDGKQYSLFAVTGMGGIGKTTLAQQIYNDPKINENFGLRSWNWISKSFTSTADLLKEIIRNTGGTSGESTTIEDLQQKLSNFLQEKSLFLVLDDVWDENISTVQLCVSIVCKAANCRILITTRHQNVAEQIGKIHIHNVSELPEESGWELLCKKVFINDDEREMQRKKDIGLKIVRQCGGLPVAIKAIASVLINRNEREWKNVLNSNAWTINKLPEYLRGALYLSYQALPSALKQCFLYFSLIPSNHGFYRENLICEWIAEGLIKKDGEVSMEDVAEQYYKEFIKRSFLQIDPDFADESKCMMHDLFLSLSHYLAGGESFSGDPQEAQTATATTKLRHLAISNKREIVSLPPNLDCLRSLFLWTPPSLDTRVIGNFKHLRVLVLNGDKIQNIPNNIGDLGHLRLLDLKETAIRELPDSLGNLTNLQFLLLTLCRSLQILPASITKLSKLRRLHLDFTSLHYLPKGIGMLKDLNDLRGFTLGDNGGDLGDGEGRGCNLEELKTLTNLKRLQIENLEKASKGVDVFGKDACLRDLELRNIRPCDGTHHAAERHVAQIWDELLPPSSVEKLVIKGYSPSWFPKWMSSTSIASHFLNLTYLLLLYCANCPRLPQLGLLPQLKYLKIHRATSVVSIGPEFLGNGVSPVAFPELEFLVFKEMTHWAEWSLGGEEDSNQSSNKPSHFPKLKKIMIDKCPELKALPRGLKQAKVFQELELRGARSLSRISDLPALKILQIEDCPMLECVEMLGSLRTLKVGQEPGGLPKWVDVLIQGGHAQPVFRMGEHP